MKEDRKNMNAESLRKKIVILNLQASFEEFTYVCATLQKQARKVVKRS